MGRHSRKGRPAKGGTTETSMAQAPPVAGTPGTPARGMPRRQEGAPAQGVPRFADGTPARGVPRMHDGTPAQGVPRFPGAPGGTPTQGVPRFPDGTPARGVPRLPDGTPAHGVPRLADGTPARGVPRVPDGTPARGVPRFADGTPAQGTPQVRGGHPQQREQGGAWGRFAAAGTPQGMTRGAPQGMPQGAPQGMTQGAPQGTPQGATQGMPQSASSSAGYADPRIPRQRQQPASGHGQEAGAGAASRAGRPAGSGAGPRQAYVDAFDEVDDVFAPGRTHRAAPGPEAGEAEEAALPDGTDEAQETAKGKGPKGRTFTGIAAAAVTTVLAVVVAGQVTVGPDGVSLQSQAAKDGEREARDSASRSDNRPTQSGAPSAAPLTYDEQMGKKYPLSADLKGDGKFQAVMGFDKAPGTGQKYRYRVDVEEGLGLDAELFAKAVQKTLNDDRSWAHNGGRTFERISSGKPDFVITLASPGTTADWCAKSGLDTTVDNVSCDSAATDRVMINAYRWAQGSKTYGDKMYAYRQMLINHEVGHRLGYNHVTCDKDGELAPVMQQQTKFLDHNGIHCRPNPWPFPGS
ncbi:DUF3152 domain-containing protein [Streptomyces sp. NPDC046862]|uniref:DUF3152 domain-containing protein n=1 Tax=Streptomyces sp. NPDC046862 TaxID=3154603 RepID=UPI0034567E1C